MIYLKYLNLYLSGKVEQDHDEMVSEYPATGVPSELFMQCA